MKFILKVILIAALSYITGLFLPWWAVVLCGFLVGALIPTAGYNSFLSGFLGVGLLWLIFAFALHNNSDGILTDRIAQLFSLGQPAFMIVISAFIGGLAGGLGALTGSQFYRLFAKEKKKSMYN
jgi:fucose permease